MLPSRLAEGRSFESDFGYCLRYSKLLINSVGVGGVDLVQQLSQVKTIFTLLQEWLAQSDLVLSHVDFVPRVILNLEAVN